MTLGSECVENSVQLVGQLSQHEGNVIICLGGNWGKVCDGRKNEAAVVCRQLGFSTTGKINDKINKLYNDRQILLYYGCTSQGMVCCSF